MNVFFSLKVKPVSVWVVDRGEAGRKECLGTKGCLANFPTSQDLIKSMTWRQRIENFRVKVIITKTATMVYKCSPKELKCKSYTYNCLCSCVCVFFFY